MKCSSPNLIYFVDSDTDNKKRVKFVNGGSRNFPKEFYKKWILSGAIEVPCGKCASCRLNYSRNWANRCYLESLCHEHSWFVTLTYTDENLVKGQREFPTLEKDAISHFIKRLRNKGIKCRYFGCGEYGDQTMRPHYHLILFGAQLGDLTIDMPDMSKEKVRGKYPIFRRKNSNGDYVMFSQTLYDCWEKGKIEVEEATWNTSAYVSRYIMKKQYGKTSVVYNHLGILPEYLRMSTKPGIAFEWLMNHKDKLLEFDYLSVKNNKGVQTSRPPRYFEKLMMKDENSLDYFLMDSNKLSRLVNSIRHLDESTSSKPLGQQLADSADFINNKSKVLKRDIT